MTNRLKPIARLSIFGAMLAALAACEPGGSATEGSQPTAETGQQTARVGTKCTTPDGGKVFFKVGEAVLALSPGEIDETIPKGLKRPFTAEDLKAELDRQTNAGGGCPEKPLDMLVLAIRVPADDTLLQGTIGLLATDPNRLSRGYADVTTRLQSNPPQTCKKLGGDLIACTGTESAGNARTEVMYIVTTDPSKKMNSGGPLAIRCAIREAKVSGCNIIDQGQGGFVMDAILKEGQYSSDTLESAWRTALAQIQARRR